MDSAYKNHIETTLEVLFLKNAYCILSMAIYLFWDSTILINLKVTVVLGVRQVYAGNLVYALWIN